jgi:hypothetical protein
VLGRIRRLYKDVDMNCPHCDFRFYSMMSNGTEIPPLAPLLCMECGNVSLLINGETRKATAEEMKGLIESPAWQAVIEPGLEVYRRHKKARNARNN